MHAETVVQTEDVSVTILTLEPGEVVPWHYHTTISDNIFCLEGSIRISLQSTDDDEVLAPGQRCEIPARSVHKVANCGTAPARYLIVQGIGKYDRILVNARDRITDPSAI